MVFCFSARVASSDSLGSKAKVKRASIVECHALEFFKSDKYERSYAITNEIRFLAFYDVPTGLTTWVEFKCFSQDHACINFPSVNRNTKVT